MLQTMCRDCDVKYKSERDDETMRNNTFLAEIQQVRAETAPPAASQRNHL